MKLSQFLSVAAVCGFAAASPVPVNDIAERENLYPRPYTLKMGGDAFKKRENLYARPYGLKMKDDAFKKRENLYARPYGLKMKDDAFEKRDE
ncbi:hypothetical protein FAUST_5225 [Fusarium austroamericanum]|uniref:Uncharacterized protein n=1 Tax=Fusarium austroamericanum TaxID=282268 RepID=A0AAN6HFY1_FUSAU|nr:hypothetical protein FAUST_5225 [Fusarium austroamericanum]